MPLIQETIITTQNKDGSTQIAPMGTHIVNKHYLIKPFKPSKTYENLLSEGCAVINYTDDVRVYAGCLTEHYDWALCSAEIVECQRLEECLAHTELQVVGCDDNDVRPTFECKILHEQTHKPFKGFNRAQAAVIELAILVSRLGMIPDDKIKTEINYLKIAIDKTAGEREKEAWGWLSDKIEDHFKK